VSGAGAPLGRDAAWVVLETPLNSAELAAFHRDLEQLYRINPFLEFASWERSAPASFRAEVLNHSNGLRSRMQLETLVRGLTVPLLIAPRPG